MLQVHVADIDDVLDVDPSTDSSTTHYAHPTIENQIDNPAVINADPPPSCIQKLFSPFGLDSVNYDIIMPILISCNTFELMIGSSNCWLCYD
jgi:hypothetical protein